MAYKFNPFTSNLDTVVDDHGLLTGLTDDDHTQYPLLLGRSGGQTLIGGTGSGDDVTLQSTSHATKGNIFLDDEVNFRPNLPTTGTLYLSRYNKTMTFTGSTTFVGQDQSPTYDTTGGIFIYTMYGGTITGTTAVNGHTMYGMNIGGTVTRSVSSVFQAFSLFWSQLKETTTASVMPWYMFFGVDSMTSEHQATGSASQTGYSDQRIVQHNASSGTYTATQTGFRSYPIVKALVSGGTMAVTTRNAFEVGDIGYTATGTVTVTNNIGLNLANMVVGTSGNRTVTNVYGIYSALQTGTNRWFIYGASTADSTVGGGFTSFHATAGLGYATGAGGTITQITSKSTGVTLNKVCGQITMNNAALAATTSVSFTLTNSAIATTDTIIVNIDSGATTGSYLTQVDAVGAGSCVITLRNYSGGSLSEAVVLNFSVIKAVTS